MTAPFSYVAQELYARFRNALQVRRPKGGLSLFADRAKNALAYMLSDGEIRYLGGGDSVDFDVFEARPLAASSSYQDLYVWSWTDVRFTPQGGITGSTNLTLQVYRDTPQIKPFVRHDQDNKLHLDIQLPHLWCGTDVLFHVHTIPMGSGSGDIYFSGQYYFGGAGDETPATASWTTFTATETVTAGDQYKKVIAPIVTCTAPASPGHSDILSIYVQREGTDPADTYKAGNPGGTAAANVCLESMDIHAQVFLTGSEEEYTGEVSTNPTRITFDPDLHIGDVYLQMTVKCDAGNSCSFQLYDETGAAAVTGSSASTTSTSYEVIEVGPLTLTSGSRQYRIQGKYDSTADEPKCSAARFVVR